MGVRAVAAGAALAVWCVSGAAMAAGYAEVWNPPEASGHVATSGKVKSGAGPKAASKHVAATKRHGNNPAAHAGVNKVAAGKNKSKVAVTAQSKKPHAQLVQTKAGPGKVVRANLVAPARQARPQAINVAAKTSTAQPAAPRANVPASPANVSANSANATSNPATASSGSLPPILH